MPVKAKVIQYLQRLSQCFCMVLAALFIGPALNARVTVSNSHSHIQRAWSSCSLYTVLCTHKYPWYNSFAQSHFNVLLNNKILFLFWGARVGSNCKESLFPYLPSPFPSTQCGTGSLSGISLDGLMVYWSTVGLKDSQDHAEGNISVQYIVLSINSITIDCNWVLKSCFSGEMKSQDLASECWVMPRWRLL